MGRKQKRIQRQLNNSNNQFAYEEGHKDAFWNAHGGDEYEFDKHQRQAYRQGYEDGASDLKNHHVIYRTIVITCDILFFAGILLAVSGVVLSIVSGTGTPSFIIGLLTTVVSYLLRGFIRIRMQRRLLKRHEQERDKESGREQ